MNRKYAQSPPGLQSRLSGLVVAIGLVASSIVQAAPQAGVPALLQFAEQYQQQSKDAAPPVTKPAVKPADTGAKPPANKTASPQGNRSSRENAAAAALWQTKDAKIRRLQETIVQLEQQMSILEKKQAKTAPAAPQISIDTAALGRLVHGVRQALSPTPEETQVKERLRQTQQQISLAQTAEKNLRTENDRLKNQLAAMKTQNQASATEAHNTLTAQLQHVEQDKITLQTHLSEAQNRNQTLTAASENEKAQLARLKTVESELRETHTQSQTQLNELLLQRNTMQKELDEQVTAAADLKAELSDLRKVAPEKIQADRMKQPAVRQAYAAGVSLGEEVLQMHAERQKWGVKVDKQVLLTGLFDTFSGQRQLDDEALNQALADSEQQVTKARNNVMATQLKQDNAYLARFKKDKQVKTTASGAWYRIDYTGDAPIPTGATLDVIIKETLTDGTVIQDMDASGAVLSQPLAQFPPLFSDALKQLKNHGSLTLVVPPELAYGEKGYPPSVPPNATMVYQLRIAEIYPETQKKKEAQDTIESSR
ncbi:FKBP-type peptidyl-prolyl cis-trans isomerase fkpA precursor [Serratia quinivorans]|uniref:FKBP-type peptidyl-prolyl cis-trans isomerase N-terminal domain-containing protein n=1 Tax=Serratia quinivorans TaxID=137545 RepID=UPI00217AEBB7|nr:FKBP-type peptidyl-prolyl cis-trans isomerase N-terminal domain-containing protein [Serratia quinivorans]CAI1873496.1 FKBP-type peptidyl-prolyl cis-trans isomerase fkpA precursor [Serratia quinivorans]CAI1900691.1 FKBP-type peptidyl-prolyl cis-trans isomerase fkpA precursor [Serratia quinivorans]